MNDRGSVPRAVEGANCVLVLAQEGIAAAEGLKAAGGSALIASCGLTECLDSVPRPVEGETGRTRGNTLAT